MKRNSMTIKVKLDERAIKPTRAHATDAGFDLYTPEMLIIRPGSSVTVDTGVHMAIPRGHVGMIKSKSGLNVNQNILSEGVIDCGYTGSIRAKLYNHGKDIVIINPGDKITQLVILPIITPLIEIVDELDDTERGEGGFGSTGR